MKHGIEFTHDDPDWDYCTWECLCGVFSRVNQIDWSFMLAAAHMDMIKEESKKKNEAIQRRYRSNDDFL